MTVSYIYLMLKYYLKRFQVLETIWFYKLVIQKKPMYFLVHTVSLWLCTPSLHSYILPIHSYQVGSPKLLFGYNIKAKFPHRETLNISTFADSSTDTITDRNGEKEKKKNEKKKLKSGKEKCYVSLSLTCYVSPVTNANSHSQKPPPPANSPTMHSRLVRKDLKTPKKFQIEKIIETAKT